MINRPAVINPVDRHFGAYTTPSTMTARQLLDDTDHGILAVSYPPEQT